MKPVGVVAQNKIRRRLRYSYGRAEKAPEGNDLKLVVRPEKAFLTGTGDQVKISGKVIDVIYLGEMVRYIVLIDDKFEFVVKQQTVGAREFLRVGDRANIGWDDGNAQLL